MEAYGDEKEDSPAPAVRGHGSRRIQPARAEVPERRHTEEENSYQSSGGSVSSETFDASGPDARDPAADVNAAKTPVQSRIPSRPVMKRLLSDEKCSEESLREDNIKNTEFGSGPTSEGANGDGFVTPGSPCSRRLMTSIPPIEPFNAQNFALSISALAGVTIGFLLGKTLLRWFSRKRAQRTETSHDDYEYIKRMV